MYNFPNLKSKKYCFDHKLPGMINVHRKLCQYDKCKLDALYGLPNKNRQFCYEHKQPNHVNLILYNKCSILDCENEFTFTLENIKYCMEHCPDSKLQEKRKCKFCDIMDSSKWICNDCKKIRNKKEWSIVRYLRKVIDTPFEYNSSKMLQGCSKKRPDIYFELAKHSVIVEIDENQHNTYDDICECARINEIVNGIGGKSVIIIRYNPDSFRNKDIDYDIDIVYRMYMLVKTIKKELIKEYNNFVVKIIQLFYDDNSVLCTNKYKVKKKEDITNIVTI